MCNNFENCTNSSNGNTNETCISMTHYHSSGAKLSLDSTGQFVLFVIFKNNISYFEDSYNFTVGTRGEFIVCGCVHALLVICDWV